MRYIFIMVASLAVACSSGGSDTADDGGDTFCEAGADRVGYPAGPYEFGVGATLDDLDMQLANGDPWSLADTHQNGANRMVFITTASGWCAACIEEQPTLRAWHDTYGPRGLEVVVSIFEDPNNVPATPAYADSWATLYQLESTVVADTDFKFAPYYPGGDTAATPLNLVVDACTMEIIYLSLGADGTAVEAIFEGRL